MKIVVMGSGAVGGYFGGLLARANQDVTFIARGQHLEALKGQGLQVKSPLGNFHLKNISATDKPTDVGVADLVLFTVKSQNTKEAALHVEPVVKGHTKVISLQNGVDNEEVLVEILKGHVLAGVAYIEATIEVPGVIVHKNSFARMVFDPTGWEGASKFLTTCQQAGINAELSKNILQSKWLKWLFICGFSGVTALTRKTIGEVVNDQDTCQLFVKTIAEVFELSKAKGINLPENIVADRLNFARDKLQPTMKSSLLRDLEQGKPLELDALNGYASKLGKQLGVPTPVNDFIYAALKLHIGGSL